MIKKIASLLFAAALAAPAFAEELLKFQEMPLPVGSGAREPFLHATGDGRLLMSWTETARGGFAVKVAVLGEDGWSAPATVTSAPDLFVNWADFPSVAAFADGTLAAHWLRRSDLSGFNYDLQLSLSQDGGQIWSAPIVPHGDGTHSQHGFATLLPVKDKIVALWLDGRAYDGALVEDGAIEGTMQLRAAVLSSDGSASADVALDFSTCSCCQTAAAMAGDALLVAYRDRTEDEIRDISVLRLQDGRWSAPIAVHADNWEIAGCPVNGPSIAARGARAVVAWFTGAGDIPAVKIAFSGDAGKSFGDAIRIDHGQPFGRVDTLMLEDGSALVSWVEWEGPDEVLMLCRATQEGCIATQRLAVNSTSGSVNFPQIAATEDAIHVAWTQPLANGHDSIRMLIAKWPGG